MLLADDPSVNARGDRVRGNDTWVLCLATLLALPSRPAAPRRCRRSL
jgi:hypothetical protein